MSKKVLVMLADGFEEMEAVTVIDILRRAGVLVLVVGVSGGRFIKGRCDISLVPDIGIDEVLLGSFDDIDMVVLPGGAVGADNLKKDERVRKIISSLHSRGKYISAICAAPSVLSAVSGVLDDRRVTSYPTFKDGFKDYSDDDVVVDGNIVTSRGPATSLDFALTILEILCGKEKLEELKEQILL